MLRKLLVVAMSGFFLVQGISAQTTTDSVYTVEVKDASKYKVETNLFGSNWFFGLGVGAQMYFGDHDKQMKFVDRLTPNFEAYFGKWFTPGIGVRFGANGYKIKGLSGWTGHRGANPNVNRGNYITCIFTYKKAENIEKDFRKVCDIFLDKKIGVMSDGGSPDFAKDTNYLCRAQ